MNTSLNIPQKVQNKKEKEKKPRSSEREQKVVVSNQWRFWQRDPGFVGHCNSCRKCDRPEGSSLDPLLQTRGANHTPETQSNPLMTYWYNSLIAWFAQFRKQLNILTSTECVYLTNVAVDMEAAIQSHNSHRLLLTWLRHYGVSTYRASGGKLPVHTENTHCLKLCLL